ncbi:tRNA-dihydrouridine synthase (plasmid) [Enterocloster clostridioformis]
MKLTIGNVTLDNNLILAPMTILYKNRNTRALLEINEGERPVAIQLFGSAPQIMADIAKEFEPGPYDIIDVKMGCPVPKIVNNGEGSALMRDAKTAEAVLTAMVKAVKKPVTVKFRKGFTEDTVNAVESMTFIENS